ncbi:MAG: replication protein O [Marinobacter sp.]|nr:replication protein O [Legionellales bacterium]MBI46736.1 replication protein O [Marinobacter sp.]MBI46796.1 replication protein O [Marinobacter sp.]
MSGIELFDRPIAFQRAFVDLGVGITGALMLSQCIYWHGRTSNKDGWFYKSQSDWEAETGMTRREQETARKRLEKAGFLEEIRKGVPAKLYFRVNVDALETALKALSSRMAESANQECTDGATSMAESAIQECTNPPDCEGGNRQSITEITSETTSETTAGKTSGPDRPDNHPAQDDPDHPNEQSQPSRPDAAIENGRFWGTQDDLDLAVWMWDALVDQLGEDKPREPKFSRWANTIRLMREQDGREHRHIRILWDWAIRHEKFWASHVQSPEKLRDKWPQVAMQRRSERRKAPQQAGIDRAAELRRIHEQRSNSQQGVTYEHQ